MACSEICGFVKVSEEANCNRGCVAVIGGRLTPPFGGICFDADEHVLEKVAYFAEVGVKDALGPTACQ